VVSEPVSNEILDEQVVQWLREYGPAPFRLLRTNLKADYRQLDRRLQVMRRKGKLRFDTMSGWSVKGCDR
jgi:hypothetical protein